MSREMDILRRIGKKNVLYALQHGIAGHVSNTDVLSIEDKKEKVMKLTTKQTARLTGIPLDLLIKMRLRNASVSLNSSPPFERILNRFGAVEYVYHKAKVEQWMKTKCCRITAAETAFLLNLTRLEVESLPAGSYSLNYGSVIAYPGKHIYIFRNARLDKALKRKRF